MNWIYSPTKNQYSTLVKFSNVSNLFPPLFLPFVCYWGNVIEQHPIQEKKKYFPLLHTSVLSPVSHLVTLIPCNLKRLYFIL